MTKERIIVHPTSPERLFTECYHDFMDCKLLNGEEKIIFLALKRFLDVKSDSGEVCPTIDTLCQITKWGKQKVINVINSLVKKNVVKKVRRGLAKSNLYIIADYKEVWAAKNTEEVKEIVENDGSKPMTAEEHIAELKKMGYDVEVKTEGTTTMPENTGKRKR